MQVVVIGAGVAGLSSAWELVRRGADVTVIEREEPGAGASTAAAGMLAPVAEANFAESALTQLGLESLRMWPEFAERLQSASEVDIGYRTEGTLVVATDRDDLEKLQWQHRLHTELGLDARMIDGDEARELEPLLSPSVPGAVHCPNDHQVNAPKVVEALAAAFVRDGGTLRTGVEVRGLVTRDDVVVDLDCDDFDAPSDATYVLAAGAWLRSIEGLGEDRPHIRPVRGQMLSVEPGDPPLCRHVIRAPDAYIVPRADEIVIGATSEERGFDPRLTAGGVMDLLVGTWEALPAVYDLSIRDLWTGFRPVALDNEPIMRRSRSLRNLVFAAGHGRNGILLTPVTGLRVADAAQKNP